MPRRQRDSSFALLCLAVAASFCFAAIEASSGHTDDGCAVELHCFACHWAFASTGVAAAPVTPGPLLAETGAVIQMETPQTVETPAPSRTSRGPPIA